MTGPVVGSVPPPFRPAEVRRFRYDGFDLDEDAGVLECRYSLDGLAFTERVTFGGDGAGGDATGSGDPSRSASLRAAARLVHLLAGVSYYKAAAPPVIEVPDGLTAAEHALLSAVYLDGLGEFAYRNGLDLGGVRIEAERHDPRPADAPGATRRRPLIPFGGGLDSIVTVDGVRGGAEDPALFVVSREGDRFDAIEQPAAATGLPVVRAGRRLDDKILRSRELGFLNGHVPVTGVISAIAVLAAVRDGRDEVVMSNEWSASSGNVEHDGRVVNHQWSKSLEFEDLFRAALADSVPGVDYFSWLRPFSELWVARRFVDLDRFHRVFRSCNRAFHIDPARRLDRWCGRCDKCCFIDLVLAPFLPAERLREVFGGAEPLDQPDLLPVFRSLVGTSADIKPFECVGDVDECRVAVRVAAAREDRRGPGLLSQLDDEVAPLVPDPDASLRQLLRPLGGHRIPAHHAPPDLLA